MYDLNKLNKPTLFFILISIQIFYPTAAIIHLQGAEEKESNLQGIRISELEFDSDTLTKWKEQISKVDQNQNGIDDSFEDRLTQLYEFKSIERDGDNINKNNMVDDILGINARKTEKITVDKIPIIVVFPQGNFDFCKLLFEKLGGEIKSIYKAAINGFAGSISYDALFEFCSQVRQRSIPFFVEEDRIYKAQLYYTGRNMNLRPYVWNTLSYDGDEYSSIAIIDTGIDDSHNFFSPGYSSGDFDYKIVGWRDEINGLTSPYDDNGHGSHCSGIASGEGGLNYDGNGRTVATTAYPFDYTGYYASEGQYLFDWTRFNVTDPGLIELFCEFDDYTPGPDDVDFWVYLYYENTLVDSYIGTSDSWSHTLSYTATSSSLGMYSFKFVMDLIDHTGDYDVDDFNIRFRTEIHWPFDPPQFGSGDPWKGVASDAHLVGVKVMNQYGYGDSSDIIAGINWVITNKEAYNITTMSLSLGSEYSDIPLINAVNNAVDEGIVTVASAGNSGPGTDYIGSPGDADNVITVAAMNVNDQITDYSSQGSSSKPDITAPGGSFYNLQMFSTDTNDNDAFPVPIPNPVIAYPTDAYANDMQGAQGTSMSAPAVAGASNLLIEAMGGHENWNYTATEAKRVKALLLMSATETYPLIREQYSGSYSPELNRGSRDRHEGYGRLNVDVAIEAYTQQLTLGSSTNAWLTSSAINPFNKHGLGCHVNLINGQKYIFTLDVPSGADFDLHLYSNDPSSIGDPTMVASSTQSGLGTQEVIIYTAASTGKYYLIAKVISGEGLAEIAYPIIEHDLGVQLEVPTDPERFSTYMVNATVFNAGMNDETNVNLFLFLNGALVDSITIPTLLVGASETINYVWTPMNYGKHNFTTYTPIVSGEPIIFNNSVTELITIWMNYTMILGVPYFWVDATDGTSVWVGNDGYEELSLPFDFQFYNETFSTIYVSENGYLSFVDTTPDEYWEDPFPSSVLEYSYMIAPFWDDIDTYFVYLKSFDHYWVAEWENVDHDDGPNVGSFEVILYDNGDIIFNYDNINYVADGYTCGLNFGLDTRYYNYYQGLTALTDNFSIKFTLPDSLTVRTPQSSSSWEKGSSYNIYWNSTGTISDVKIELYMGGVFEREIISSTSNDGVYSWTIPSDLDDSTQYQIKIIDISNPLINDFSEFFEIKSPSKKKETVIPGYNHYILIGILCIISTLIVKLKITKRNKN
ncbi:MAG: S8 family serine peptidase [Candidatus Hodarchaeota archaeon]